MTNEVTIKEFDRQVENLLQKNYPKSANLTAKEFLKYTEPLKQKLQNITLPEIDLEKGIYHLF